MFCKNCGKEIENNSKFCKNCGSKVEKTNLSDVDNEKLFYISKLVGSLKQVKDIKVKNSLDLQPNNQKEKKLFCKECGKEISGETKFCPNCGASQDNSSKENVEVTVQSSKKESDSQESKATSYAGTALKAAVFGLLFWCCCGIQLIAGAPAIYFGYLAIRNNEPEREKAYIAIGVGILDVIGFIILMIAVIRSK